jgi:hypothetical protein
MMIKTYHVTMPAGILTGVQQGLIIQEVGQFIAQTMTQMHILALPDGVHMQERLTTNAEEEATLEEEVMEELPQNNNVNLK